MGINFRQNSKHVHTINALTSHSFSEIHSYQSNIPLLLRSEVHSLDYRLFHNHGAAIVSDQRYNVRTVVELYLGL
jgi:hypothetical protein